MNIVIDFGNTRAKVGIIENQGLKKVVHYETGQINTEDFISHLRSLSPSAICYLNVRPVESEILDYFSACKSQIIHFDHTFKLPFSVHYEAPEKLGIDRLAGVVGGHSLFPENDFLVIQSGTCITYDLFLKDKGYMGGAISPGVHIRNKSMNTFTHQLPLVDTESVECTEIIAKNTNDSLLSGILNGTLFEMEGFIEAAHKQSGNLNIILSGGNTLYFAKKIKRQIFANSNITLIGLKEIIKFNEQTKKS